MAARRPRLDGKVAIVTVAGSQKNGDPPRIRPDQHVGNRRTQPLRSSPLPLEGLWCLRRLQPLSEQLTNEIGHGDAIRDGLDFECLMEVRRHINR